MPTTVEEVEKLSWGQLLYLAGENAEALASTAQTRRRRRHPPPRHGERDGAWSRVRPRRYVASNVGC
jgi:hypothetical protein